MMGCSHECTHEDAALTLVVVGRIGAPYGIQGWQHIHSFTNPIENILLYKKWFVQQKEQWLPFELMDGRRHGQGIVAQLSGINDPETAALLTNNDIAVLRAHFATLPEDEFYWTDLVGLSVQTKNGEMLGSIDYIYENAGMDVLVVKSQDKERHIPFLMHDTVLKVDLTSRQVIVDWDPAL